MYLGVNTMSDVAPDFLKPSWVSGEAVMGRHVASEMRKPGLTVTLTKMHGHQDHLNLS